MAGAGIDTDKQKLRITAEVVKIKMQHPHTHTQSCASTKKLKRELLNQTSGFRPSVYDEGAIQYNKK